MRYKKVLYHYNSKHRYCRWVTPKINQRNRKCVILSEEKAEEIRKLISKGLKNSEIGKMYKVHEDTINDIKRGKTWN